MLADRMRGVIFMISRDFWLRPLQHSARSGRKAFVFDRRVTKGPSFQNIMHSIRRLSLVEQTASHVIEGLRAGHWGGKLPGVQRLATECDVSRNTMRAVFRLLEGQGVLAPAGRGRSRTVRPGGRSSPAKSALRVAVLLKCPLSEEEPDVQGFLLKLQHDLEAAGHACVFARKCQMELRDDLPRMKRQVRETEADAWVILRGTRPLLEWFAQAPVPALALGGRALGVPIASVGSATLSGCMEAVRLLAGLGHRRIVLLTSREMRHPIPPPLLAEIIAEIVPSGSGDTAYHLPDWDETPAGLVGLLRELFRFTPPTAIVVIQTNWMLGVLSFLAQRRLRVPADVSLVSAGIDSDLVWHSPPLAHLRSQDEQLLRRIMRWVGAAARGRADRKSELIPVEFIHGESIAPPPRRTAR